MLAARTMLASPNTSVLRQLGGSGARQSLRYPENLGNLIGRRASGTATARWWGARNEERPWEMVCWCFGCRDTGPLTTRRRPSSPWSVDTRDWSVPGVRHIVDTILTRTRPGSIILDHDGGGNRAQTVAALGIALPRLLDAGYHFHPAVITPPRRS